MAPPPDHHAPRSADTRQGQRAGWAGISKGDTQDPLHRRCSRAGSKAKARLIRRHKGCTCSVFQEALVLMHRKERAAGGL